VYEGGLANEGTYQLSNEEEICNGSGRARSRRTGLVLVQHTAGLSELGERRPPQARMSSRGHQSCPTERSVLEPNGAGQSDLRRILQVLRLRFALAWNLPKPCAPAHNCMIDLCDFVAANQNLSAAKSSSWMLEPTMGRSDRILCSLRAILAGT